MGAEQRESMGTGLRVVAGIGVVVGLAWSYPAWASWGLAMAPAELAGVLDTALCFAPLLWAPLPAAGLFWMTER